MSSRSRQRKTPETKVGLYENDANTVIHDIREFIDKMEDKTPSELVEITETYISIVGILQKYGDIVYDLFGDFIDAIHSQKDSRKVLKQKGGVAISMGLNAARAAKNRKRRENRIRAYDKKKEEERIEKEINDQRIAKEKKINDARINEEHAKKIQENTTQIGPYGLPLPHDQRQSYDFADILDDQQIQKIARDRKEQQRLWDLGAPQREQEAQERQQSLNDQVGQQFKYEAEVRTQVMCLISFLAVILLFIDRKNVLSFIKSFFKSSSKKDDYENDDRSTPWTKVLLPPTYTSSTRRGTRYSVETEDRSERYKYIRDPQRRGGKSKKMRTRNITQKKGY
jgi:hypothetical protein